jgi:hypothetical protein
MVAPKQVVLRTSLAYEPPSKRHLLHEVRQIATSCAERRWNVLLRVQGFRKCCRKFPNLFNHCRSICAEVL